MIKTSTEAWDALRKLGKAEDWERVFRSADMAEAYANYIRSTAWDRKRFAACSRAGWKCEKCGVEGRRVGTIKVTGLEAHHLTYDRIGMESDEDLVVLCRSCHAGMHGRRTMPTRGSRRIAPALKTTLEKIAK